MGQGTVVLLKEQPFEGHPLRLSFVHVSSYHSTRYLVEWKKNGTKKLKNHFCSHIYLGYSGKLLLAQSKGEDADYSSLGFLHGMSWIAMGHLGESFNEPQWKKQHTLKMSSSSVSCTSCVAVNKSFLSGLESDFCLFIFGPNLCFLKWMEPRFGNPLS